MYSSTTELSRRVRAFVWRSGAKCDGGGQTATPSDSLKTGNIYVVLARTDDSGAMPGESAPWAMRWMGIREVRKCRPSGQRTATKVVVAGYGARAFEQLCTQLSRSQPA